MPKAGGKDQDVCVPRNIGDRRFGDMPFMHEPDKAITPNSGYNIEVDQPVGTQRLNS
jgi:hypothetical protein